MIRTALPPTRTQRTRAAFSTLLGLVIAVAVLGGSGCGSSSTDCATLLQQYSEELASAITCDPNITTSQCFAQRPVTVAQEGGPLEGLASNCTHAVNGSRTARLDQILAEYTASGCKSLPVPVCQSPRDVCGFSQFAGTTICLP